MLTIHSFLQNVYRFVKSLVIYVTKKMYRSALILTTGLAVITVVTFGSSGFGGGSKNAMAAYHEPEDEQTKEKSDQTLGEFEGTEAFTKAKKQVELTASKQQGQQLVGNLLEKKIQQNIATSAAEIKRIEKEVLMQAQEAEAEAKERERLAREQEKKDRAVISYSESDYQVLLRIVQAEAGICDEVGKILVANVIINRVRDSEFPNNITDVVYQKSQFSPVDNGSINTVKITQETINCVDRALAGEDYSQGALFFMNRGISQSGNVRWFDGNLTLVLQHQRHEFFK